MKRIFGWFLRPAKRIDAVILSLFAIGITAQPFLLHQTINLFELGLYLPGIDAVLCGQVPFRDFFYLRGPFELYMPAVMMHFFGENLAVLPLYFYLGTVIALITCIWIAFEIYPGRLFLYVMVPVFVARTFPRVVFAYWGGMRYAWGLLAALCLIRFLRKGQKYWMFTAGLLTACAALTSIEIGFSVFVAFIVAAVLSDRHWQKAVSGYLIGVGVISLPYFLYLLQQGALTSYINSQWVIVTQMMGTFLPTEAIPSNVGQFLHALFVFTDKNFRQLTPVYCYLVLAVYLCLRMRRKGLDRMDYAIMIVAAYGLMLYITAFRTIWQSVFEMALQPEKIILFYLLARISLQLVSKQNFKKIGYILIIAIFASSLGYSIPRFSKRFFVFWRNPLKNQSTVQINLPRIKGMVIPQWQAEDLAQLKEFVNKHTAIDEAIWMYPELGSLHFILERPWIGKFPTATLAWIDDTWYDEYMEALLRVRPRYAIFERKSPQHFAQPCYSQKAKNYFKTQLSYLEGNYTIISSTPTYDIYARKNPDK